MVKAPEKLWMTAEEMGWPGSFRSFRMSDLEHPEDEYPAYVRADLYEQVKRERDELALAFNSSCEIRERLASRTEAAERPAGARVKPLEWQQGNDGPRYEYSTGGEYQIYYTGSNAETVLTFGARRIHVGRFTGDVVGAKARAAAQSDHERRILSDLAEPAGEAEPVACVACEDNPKGENNPCAVCGKTLTPPDASAIREALERIVKLRKDIVSDVGTAHKLRGNGASDWMREDDRDFRRDLNSAFDAAKAALAGAKP